MVNANIFMEMFGKMEIYSYLCRCIKVCDDIRYLRCIVKKDIESCLSMSKKKRSGLPSEVSVTVT